MNGTAVRLRNVGKRYRHFALEGVDLDVARGRALGRGGPALPITIGVEAAGVAAIAAVMLWLQGRKTSFV
jgi:hypothetical protein